SESLLVNLPLGGMNLGDRNVAAKYNDWIARFFHSSQILSEMRLGLANIQPKHDSKTKLASGTTPFARGDNVPVALEFRFVAHQAEAGFFEDSNRRRICGT